MRTIYLNHRQCSLGKCMKAKRQYLCTKRNIHYATLYRTEYGDLILEADACIQIKYNILTFMCIQRKLMNVVIKW